MNIQTRQLLMEQVDKRLQKYRKLPRDSMASPREGWISSIRKALGMSTRALAERLDVSQSAVAQYEKSERRKTISLQTLEKVAHELDAELVYAIVPRHSIKTILDTQAELIAKSRILPLANSMSLEAQSTSSESLDRDVLELKNQLLKNPRELWR